jgi:hypothetical protein
VTVLACILLTVALAVVVAVHVKTELYLRRRATLLDKRHKQLTRDAMRTRNVTETLQEQCIGALEQTQSVHRAIGATLGERRVKRLIEYLERLR